MELLEMKSSMDQISKTQRYFLISVIEDKVKEL
jgi:hypothetical protein